MYRILAALRMHRPSISVDNSYATDVMQHRDSRGWRLWPYNDMIVTKLEDPRHFRVGNLLGNLDEFRMPSGPRNLEWLERADSAVSICRAFYPQSYQHIEALLTLLS